MAMMVVCLLALSGCGGAPQGIPDASSDQITMADPAVKVSEMAAPLVTFDKADVSTADNKFTVKITLKAAKDLSWNEIFINYVVKNKEGGRENFVLGNFASVPGPVSSGAAINLSVDVFRDKPAGQRFVEIQDVGNVNPAP